MILSVIFRVHPHYIILRCRHRRLCSRRSAAQMRRRCSRKIVVATAPAATPTTPSTCDNPRTPCSATTRPSALSRPPPPSPPPSSPPGRSSVGIKDSLKTSWQPHTHSLHVNTSRARYPARNLLSISLVMEDQNVPSPAEAPPDRSHRGMPGRGGR